MRPNDFIEKAKVLLNKGFNVIPLCSGTDTSYPDKQRGKRPIVAWDKYKNETATEAELYAWAAMKDELNIGIVCGVTSNITVVDADTQEAVDMLEGMNLPDTLKVKTKKGYHYYYKYCANPVLSNAVRIVEGVDIRTQGGQVVAPGSQHVSGFIYSWFNEGTPIAEFPQALEDLFTASAQKTRENNKDVSNIAEGSRNSSLTSLAGSMKHLGMSYEVVLAATMSTNSGFSDPLPDSEVETIVRSICRYEANEKKYKCTELGVAERFIAKYDSVVRFNVNSGNWMIYDGIRWAEQSTDKRSLLCSTVTDKIIALIRSIPNEVPKESEYRKAYEDFARSLESANKLKGLHGLIAGSVPANMEQFDKNPFILNLLNKTINLSTMEIKEHSPKDYLAKVMPVNYDASAQCSLWSQFVSTVFNNDTELISFIQRAVGYTLTGDTTEQVFFTLYGSGANGKSVFLDTLLHLFGAYGQQSTFSTFLSKAGDGGIRNDIAGMAGARFVSAAESGVFKTLDDALIKDITGGKSVKARFLHKEFFEFTPQMKLWLATNHKPNIYDDSNGMWRRVKLIPFNVTIANENQDKNLYYKLLKELPGILNWCLEGFKQWKTHGLGKCDSIDVATSDYKVTMDLLGQFIDEKVTLNNASTIKSSALYSSFSEWCKQNGENPWTNKTFSIKMCDKGYKKIRVTDGIVWQGLEIVSEY